MARMAVDVVLLPDEAMMNRAIEINRQLVRAPPTHNSAFGEPLTNGRPEIVLNKADCRPHISLAMGCIDETVVEAVRERLEELARKTTVRELRIMGVVSSTNSRGETTSLLDLEKTEGLQSLHEQVMQEMMPLFSYDVSEAMIHDDVVAPSTLDWIRTYPQKAGYEHFRPHITVGYGHVPAEVSCPIPFTVTQLALCHLGNHCTCRTVLATAALMSFDEQNR